VGDDSYKLGSISAYDGLSQWKWRWRDLYNGEDSSSTTSTRDTNDLPTTPKDDIPTHLANKTTTLAPHLQLSPTLESLQCEWLSKERLYSNPSIVG
jgi:hypothetical protein